MLVESLVATRKETGTKSANPRDLDCVDGESIISAITEQDPVTKVEKARTVPLTAMTKLNQVALTV